MHHNCENFDIQELVIVFNKFPRPETSGSGLDENHWLFAVKHIPLTPPSESAGSDTIFFVHPQSNYGFCGGLAQILSVPSASEQAEIVIPLLLKGFVKRVSPFGHPTLRSAPSRWGTDNMELARALEKRLRSLGFRKELCKIEVGNFEKNKWLHNVWISFLAMTRKQRGLGPICNKCGPYNDAEKLGSCPACKKVKYCSTDCQKKDWKDHEMACRFLTLLGSGRKFDHSSSAIVPHYYYNHIAPHITEAQELAGEIGLTLSGQGRPSQDLITPIRCLVFAGKDLPQHIITLFGNEDAQKAKFKKTRMEVLLNPPPGSPMYIMSSFHEFHERSLASTPREASVEEAEELQEIKDMQEMIRRHMGSRDMSTFTSMDLEDILWTHLGARVDWSEKLELYQIAMNAMDQGVPLPLFGLWDLLDQSERAPNL